jgi:hypothetical protein
MQFVIGVSDAYAMIDSLANAQFGIAIFCGACMLLVASRVPPPNPKKP